MLYCSCDFRRRTPSILERILRRTIPRCERRNERSEWVNFFLGESKAWKTTVAKRERQIIREGGNTQEKYRSGQLAAGYKNLRERAQVIEGTEGWAPPGQRETPDWSSYPRTWRTAAARPRTRMRQRRYCEYVWMHTRMRTICPVSLSYEDRDASTVCTNSPCVQATVQYDRREIHENCSWSPEHMRRSLLVYPSFYFKFSTCYFKTEALSFASYRLSSSLLNLKYYFNKFYR